MKARIREIYTQPALAQRVALLRAECDLLGGVETAMERAGELAGRAKSRVAALPPSSARDALMDLSDYVLERRW